MNRFALLSVAALACSLAAQSNVVPGLDGKLEILDNITYWGRRGAAHPGGEVGLSMRNTMCNPGSVSIPWYAQMQENHPKFGFLITRLSNDRMEQISDRSYCKHAFTSASTSGACGACNGISGNQMGVTCSDTYTAGHNAGRGNLGPPHEIDPWLGTWNHIGSYFDQGDPNVGAPGNTDGNQSNITAGDDVKNRVTVKETDLLTAGAQYFYGIQLIHQGEAVANRWDNIKSRGFVPTWSGSSWSVGNSAVGEAFGSILQHWPGATVNSGGNGNDDGRFFVASKATSLGGGMYHYEYAVHNVDNSRAGATLRVPIDAGVTASNFTFRDIDSNALNNWTAARVGNEIVFTAPGNNPLEWNTIYNFGFDANAGPGNSFVVLDEARVGPGANQVLVGAKAPSGAIFAQATNYGVGCGGAPACGGSFYQSFASNAFDLSNSGLTITTNGGQSTVGALTGSWITPAGTTLNLGDDTGVLQALPFALPHAGGTTSQLWVNPNGFLDSAGSDNSYQPTAGGLIAVGKARWAPLWRDLNRPAGGTIHFDATAQRVVVSWLNVRNYSGTATVTFQAQFWPNGTVHFIYQTVGAPTNGATVVGYSPGVAAVDPGGTDLSVAIGSGFAPCAPIGPAVPSLAFTALNRPVLGTTVNLEISNALPGTQVGALVLSLTKVFPGIDLTSSGMPGCFQYVTLEAIAMFPMGPGSATLPWALPSTPSLAGTLVFGQSATYVPFINAENIVTSNAVEMLLGVN
ncbi:MAG: hypothetical protein JNL12_13105 [Planctomycetes bacterium]|nr:hypothetical protein [Planctomycetota bacterium]